jgi:exodeoxyribonuclease VII large subunit
MAQQHILQVSELTKKVRFILESELNTVWICGEISNFIAAGSGHWYLSLKDKKSQVRCAMFKGNNQRVRITPRNGQQVLVRAKVSLYEPRGDFQLIIEQMDDAGEGLLRQQYQQLKSKLNSEGLFDVTQKQPLPKHITTVGIVTSPTGAAVKDIITVLKRRNPTIKVIIYPALVQGEQAKYDICQAIQNAEVQSLADVLIIGRGGGSLEDLWAFNEEIVARTIHQCSLPTISAVGHEIDTTLADYTADVRAATPSAAAEIVSVNIEELRNRLLELTQRTVNITKQQLSECQRSHANLSHRLAQVHPEQQLQNQQQRCDDLTIRLERATQQIFNNITAQPNYLAQRLQQCSPQKKIKLAQSEQSDLAKRLSLAQHRVIDNKTEQFSHLIEQLQIVSPLATIARGYSIARNQRNAVIRKIEQVKVKDNVEIQLSDGKIKAQVSAILPN